MKDDSPRSERTADIHLARAAAELARHAYAAADHGRSPEYYRARDALKAALAEG